MTLWDPNAVLGVVDDDKCIGHSVRDGSQKCRRQLSTRKASSKHEALVLLSDAPLESITLEQLKALVAVGLCHSHRQQARGLALELRGKAIVYALPWDGIDDEDSDSSGDEVTFRSHNEKQVLQPSSRRSMPGSWPVPPSQDLLLLSSRTTPSPQIVPADDVPESQHSTGRAPRRRLNGENRFTPYGLGPRLNSDRPSLSMNLNKRLFRTSTRRSRPLSSFQGELRVTSRSTLDADASGSEPVSTQALETSLAPEPVSHDQHISLIQPSLSVRDVASHGANPTAQTAAINHPHGNSFNVVPHIFPSTILNRNEAALKQRFNGMFESAQRARRYQQKAQQSRKDLRIFLIAGNKLKASCADHVMRRPYIGETCGICKEEMSGNDPGALMWCLDGCGQSFHARPECLTAWLKVSATCPHCRIPWSSKVCACDPWIHEVLMGQD